MHLPLKFGGIKIKPINFKEIKMKKFIIIPLVVNLLFFNISCESEEEAEVLQNRDTAGILIDVSGSGSVLGSPTKPEDLSNSTVAFSVNSLLMNVEKISGIEDEILKFEIVKQYNGGTEVSVATYDAAPFSLKLGTLDEFLLGSGVNANQLRIGDIFTFTVKVHQKDGDIYTYKGQSFNITINCFANLTGAYTVTNSLCGSGSSGTIPTINISQTPDGNWYLETADGGLLQYCTSNTGLVNDGIISVVCGSVQPSNNISFCPDYGIGCITGGSWDQENGILELKLNDSFFGIGDYTATYKRQD